MAQVEQRIAVAGDVIRLDGTLLYTFKKAPFEIGINGTNKRWTVGKPPKQGSFEPEVIIVTADTAEADLWGKEGNGEPRIIRRLTASAPNLFNLPGRDLQVKVVAVAPTPTPAATPATPPDIKVGPTPFPLVRPGESIAQALARGSCSLQPGVVYGISSTVGIPGSGRTIAAAGDGPLPVVEMTGTGHAFEANGVKDLTVQGIEVRSANRQNSNAAVRGFNAFNLRVLGCYLHGFRQGVSVENPIVKGDLTVWDTWLRDNANVGGHGVGIYCDFVRYDVRRCHFDHNGWREAQTVRDEFSHNFYGQGTCLDGGVFEDVLSNDASSHGCQLRAGGSFKRFVSLNCPVGFSYGLVNGSMCHPGGVRGEIEDVWTLGCPAIAKDHRPGWAGHFSNILDVTANGIYADGDDLGINKAFILEPCKDLKNPGGYVGVKKLALNGLCAPKWQKGVLAENGLAATEKSIVVPSKGADLRAALGGVDAFLASVRGKPSTAAARALAILHTAWGVN